MWRELYLEEFVPGDNKLCGLAKSWFEDSFGAKDFTIKFFLGDPWGKYVEDIDGYGRERGNVFKALKELGEQAGIKLLLS